MWLARMNRASASGPPCSGSGAPRSASANSVAGVVGVGSASSGSIAAESYCPVSALR